jgi:shikimate kinase
MGTVLLLAGPKGVGKSWIAGIVERELGVRYLDADALILDLVAEGIHPDPEDGWLDDVERAVVGALLETEAISVEVTGAWESDYKLAQHLEDRGHRVIRVWVIAPRDETIARLKARLARKYPVTEAEARSTYERACARAAREQWDVVLETSGDMQPEPAVEAIRHAFQST